MSPVSISTPNSLTHRERSQARMAVDDALRPYNYRRPHMSLDYRIPADVHGKVA